MPQGHYQSVTRVLRERYETITYPTYTYNILRILSRELLTLYSFREQTERLLEEVAHFDVEIGEVVVVLPVDRHGPVGRENKVLVHANLESDTCSHMGHIDILRVVEIVLEALTFFIVVIESIAERCVIYERVASDEFVQVIRLCDDTEVEEGVEPDIEMLPLDIEIDDTEAELDIGESKSVGEDAVGHHTADGVTAAESFVIDALDEKRVHIVVHIEGRASGDIVLRAEAIGEGNTVDAVLVGITGHIMAESEVELEMVVSRSSLLAVCGIESGGVSEESVGIDALVGSLAFVARVEGDTGAEVRMPTAFALIRSDESPRLVLVVKSLHGRVEGFLLIALFFRVELILAVEHVDITVVDDIAENSESGIPFEVLVDRSLDVSGYTDEVAFVLIEDAGLIILGMRHLLGLFLPEMPVGMVEGLESVESVEVAHGVRQIGGVEREAVSGNEVFGVVVEAENAVVLGGIGGLEIEGVDIFGVLRTVTVVIDVRQHTALETVIGVIGDRRQDSEVPSGLDLTSEGIDFLRFGFFLLGGKRQCDTCG